MKTSNRLFALAVVVLLASIVSYNFSLKAEYNKKAFTSEFYEYKTLGFKNFNEIEVKCANVLDLRIYHSDTFKVKIRGQYKPRYVVDQKRNRLIIHLKDRERAYSEEKEVVIFCPQLNKLILNGEKTSFYDRKDSLITEITEQDWRRTVVEGFELDSLSVNLGEFNTLKLNKNTIKNFNAKVGDAGKEGSKLVIGKDNILKNAFFDIGDKNELQLQSPQIDNFRYKYSADATISLRGKSHSLLK